MSHSLSKSRYTLFRQCAKALWLRINKPEEAMVDASTQKATADAVKWDEE